MVLRFVAVFRDQLIGIDSGDGERLRPRPETADNV
jgi:hypothetical protein